MRILFTGASSFTGFWFVRELARAGHAVTATFRQPFEGYEGVRRERVRLLQDHCEPIVGCSFGSPEFLRLILLALYLSTLVFLQKHNEIAK